MQSISWRHKLDIGSRYDREILKQGSKLFTLMCRRNYRRSPSSPGRNFEHHFKHSAAILSQDRVTSEFWRYKLLSRINNSGEKHILSQPVRLTSIVNIMMVYTLRASQQELLSGVTYVELPALYRRAAQTRKENQEREEQWRKQETLRMT